MKVSSINTIKYNSNMASFKHTAVPYPEYSYAYSNSHSLEKKISNIIDRITDLFHPSVTKEAKNIKSQIDNIYLNGNDCSYVKNNLIDTIV